jgi:antirestriction protein ArdC
LAKEAHFKTLGAEEWSRLRRDEEQNATEAQTRVGRDMMVPVLSAAAVRSEWDDLPDTSTANRYTNTFLRLQRQSENASLTSAEKAQNARDQDKYIKSLRRREVPERPEESWEQIEEMMARVRTAKNKVESDIAELLKKRKKKK